MLIRALGVAVAGILLLLFWKHPKRAWAVWLLGLTMIPVWMSLHFLVAIPVHCLIGAVGLIAVVFYKPVAFTRYDAYFCLFIGVSLLVLAFNSIDPHAMVKVFVAWVIPYAAARIIVGATGTRYAVDAVAVMFGVVGALAVVELIANWHPFVDWNTGTSTSALWQPIQIRAGRVRSEWAFGHSIALGGSLALSIPFVARSSFSSPFRALLLAVVGAGVLASGSRGALIAAGLTAAVCILNSNALRRVRPAVISLSVCGAVMGAILLGPAVSTWVIGTSYGDRTSALYRGEIYSSFLPRIEVAAPYDVYAPGENADKSIDSAVLDLGLRFGWVVLVLAAIPLMIAGIRVLSGKASLAEIALVGQIPLYATVAFITQYEQWIFMVLGVAVCLLIEKTAGDKATDFDAAVSEGSAAPTEGQRHGVRVGDQT